MMKDTRKRCLGLMVALFFCCWSYAEGVWTLVTDVSTLKTGDKIIIVSSVADRALGTTQNTNNRKAVVITKNSDNTCTISEEVQQLTLQQGKVTETFAFYTGSGYLYAASSSSNYLRTEIGLTKNSSWSISMSSNGVISVIAKGDSENNVLKHNPDSYIFSCYNSNNSQADVLLYKYSEVPDQPATIILNDNGALSEVATYLGASYSLPATASDFDGLEFVGWSKTPIAAGATPASDAILLPGASVTVEEGMAFYAVYAKPVEVESPAYVKVEAEQTDWSGTYLIVCESEGKAFNASLGEDALFATNASNAVEITISDNKIELTEETVLYEFVIEKYNEGYSIKSKSDYYIGNKIASGSYVGVASTSKTCFVAEYSETVSPIRANGGYLCYSKGAFSYSSNQHTPIQLYKRTETTKSYTFYATSLSVDIAINTYGYSTWYSGMPVAVPEGMKAYSCVVEGSTAVLHDMGAVIPANTGAVLYAAEAVDAGKTYTMSYSGAGAADVAGNALVGYVHDTEVNNGKAHYALNVKEGTVGFFVPQTATGDYPSATSPFTAKAGKAYLELDPAVSVASLVIRRSDDTSIGTIAVAPENVAYDLLGRRVTVLSKGIYIVNGRKVVM